jgi:UDP:flavonoid glycosyltransferase YjiC (YdhE family)
LENGEPPVYMTFGSFNLLNVDGNLKLLCDAARLTSRRAIVQTVVDEATYTPDDSNIYVIGKAPHHELFPRCAAVVHHGGSGTTQSTVYSGVPSVVVEHAFDQIFWGETLQRAGVAKAPLHKRKITPEKIAHAVNQVVTDPAMEQQAKALGQIVRQEKGVATAVKLIESIFQQ